MATLSYSYRNNGFLLIALLTSVLTAMLLQLFNPALILISCLLPWIIILFNYFPLVLVLLWHVLSTIEVLNPDTFFPVGPIQFVLLDPAYFFSLAYIATEILLRP